MQIDCEKSKSKFKKNKTVMRDNKKGYNNKKYIFVLCLAVQIMVSNG